MSCTRFENLETESLEDIWEEGRAAAPCEECLDEALPWLLLASVDNPDEGLPKDCDKEEAFPPDCEKCLSFPPPACFSADFELRDGWGDPPLLQDLLSKSTSRFSGGTKSDEGPATAGPLPPPFHQV